jgi:hypothetical protein
MPIRNSKSGIRNPRQSSQILAVPLLPLLFAVASCTKRADAVYAKALIGTWSWSTSWGGGPMKDSMHGQTTYEEGGILRFESRIISAEGERNVSGTGTWRVENGHVLWTINTSSAPDILPTGLSASDKIIRVTETKYTYIDGATQTRETELRVR